MTKKIVIVCMLFLLALSGCGKNNNEPTNDTTQGQEDKTNIKIFAKDEEISYKKYISKDEDFKDINEYEDLLIDQIYNLRQGRLVTLDNNETITLNFGDNWIEDNEINIETLYLKEDAFELVGEEDIKVNKDGVASFNVIYDNNDKSLEAVCYEVTVKFKDTFCKYAFSIQVSNQTVQNEQTTNVSKYLSQDEQIIYDKYKKDKNIKDLQNIEPLTIAKIYVQAIMEQQYELAYSLYEKDDDNPSKEDFISLITNLDQNIREYYITNIKAVENGTFVQESEDSGYIEYELTQDHPMAIDMEKEDNIWKIEYLPLQ